MTDEQAAKLREVAERSRDAHAAWATDPNAGQAARAAMYQTYEAYTEETREDVLLDLLDERDAALALLRTVRMSLDYWMADENELRPEWRDQWDMDIELLARIDALLGKEAGK